MFKVACRAKSFPPRNLFSVFSGGGFLVLCILSLSQPLKVQGLTLTWRAPDSGPAVAGYCLYVREASEIRLVRIDIGNVTKHRIAGLVAGNSYSFHLTAYNFNGLESEPSNTFVYQLPAVANDLQPTIAVFSRYGFIITWNSELGKSYIVTWKSDLNHGSWTTISQIVTAIGPSTSWVVGLNHDSHGFYGVMEVD